MTSASYNEHYIWAEMPLTPNTSEFWYSQPNQLHKWISFVVINCSISTQQLLGSLTRAVALISVFPFVWYKHHHLIMYLYRQMFILLLYFCFSSRVVGLIFVYTFVLYNHHHLILYLHVYTIKCFYFCFMQLPPSHHLSSFTLCPNHHQSDQTGAQLPN